MTAQDKLTAIKVMMDISDTSLDAALTTYLSFAENEILDWMYSGKVPEGATVPRRYENVQIHSVVYGFNHKGAEGEIVHNESGVNRTFVYDDMISYIRSHVYHLIG